MSAKICPMCGNETNEPDGVCVICKFDKRLGKITPDGGGEMVAREKTKCEVEGCIKQQWTEHRCMVHYNEKHGIVKEKHNIVKKGKKAKILPEAKAKKESVIERLTEERDSHRQALLEIEAVLNGIAKYAGIVIPTNLVVNIRG